MVTRKIVRSFGDALFLTWGLTPKWPPTLFTDFSGHLHSVSGPRERRETLSLYLSLLSYTVSLEAELFPACNKNSQHSFRSQGRNNTRTRREMRPPMRTSFPCDLQFLV